MNEAKTISWQDFVKQEIENTEQMAWVKQSSIKKWLQDYEKMVDILEAKDNEIKKLKHEKTLLETKIAIMEFNSPIIIDLEA